MNQQRQVNKKTVLLANNHSDLDKGPEQESPTAGLSQLSAQIRRALTRWRDSLINLDGRNKLLYFNPSRTTKSYITFSESTPNQFPRFDSQIIKEWLSQESIKASELHAQEYSKHQELLRNLKGNKDLLPGQVQRELERSDWARLLKSYKLIYQKQKENFDERNIETCFLAIDLLTWNRSDSGPDPRAPLVLIPLIIKPRGRGNTDFEIIINGDEQINDVLTTFLKSQFNIVVEEPGPDTPRETLRSHFDGVRLQLPEGRIERSWTITNFSFLQMPMVKDIQKIEANVEDGEELSGLLQALAGQEPSDAINPDFDESDIWQVLEDEAQAEFLVFPTDQSQHRAIAAAITGQSIVIQGPPGTGKSQTIANCIAELTARGKRVLFVAEKRAAIDAVVTRLHEKGLDSLVLDLHGEPVRKTIASQLLALTTSSNDKPGLAEKSRLNLDETRKSLQERWDMLHAPLPPGLEDEGIKNLHGLLVATGQAETSEIGELTFPFRSRSKELLALGLNDSDEIGANLEELQNLGWLDPTQDYSSMKSLVTSISTLAEAEQLCADLSEVAARWSDFVLNATDWVDRDRGQFDSMKEILLEIETGLDILHLAKDWDVDLLISCYEEEPYVTKDQYSKNHKHENFVKRFFGWRSLDRRYRDSYVRDGDMSLEAMRKELSRIMGLFSKRRRHAKKRSLKPVKLSRDLSESFSEIRYLAKKLGKQPNPVKSIFDMPLDDSEALLHSLLLQRSLIETLPSIKAVRDQVIEKGALASDLLEFFEEEKPANLKIKAWLIQGFYETLLREVLDKPPFSKLQDPQILDNLISALQINDEKHLQDNPKRVKQKVLNYFEQNPLMMNSSGHRVLVKESNKKSQHLPFRKLMEQASEVVFALKPCFAMSPLNVSRLLPCEAGLFDVVIFDEASQIRPEDSIPSIYRAKQVVVAGDRYQLAPTDAFRRDDDDTDDDEEFEDTEAPATAGLESILDAMRGILLGASTFPLANHYRSRHERLISFSNKTVYTPENQPLLTFPSASSPTHSVLSYDYLDEVRTSGIEEPNTREIEAVIQAVRRHMQERPVKSLGVIAFGNRHAGRLGDALSRAEAEDDQVFAFIKKHEETTEPLFIKNIERVQGDERDYIIISPGYAPRPDGKVALRFGSLNTDGGERRINVAASRAKEGMQLITSLKASDLDLQRSQSRGVLSLRRFLEFMESGGTVAFESDGPRTETPFEDSIYNRLTKEGLQLECQWGDSGFRIDFAVKHPQTPDAFVLAIEADGASYHSSRYARERDALRQKILEDRGWQFVRIWSTDWFRNPDKQVHKVMKAYHQAISNSGLDEFEPSSSAEVELLNRDLEASLPIASQLFLAIQRQHPSIDSVTFYEKWLSYCGYPRSTSKTRKEFEQLAQQYT